MSRRHAPKPPKSDLRKDRELAVLRETNDLLRARLARVPSERRLSSRILDGLLRLLIELGCWTAVLLTLPVYALRFVLMLPVYGFAAILSVLSAILGVLTYLRLRLTIAKINLIYRDDEPGRLLTLAAIEATLAEMFAEMPEDESESDE